LAALEKRVDLRTRPLVLEVVVHVELAALDGLDHLDQQFGADFGCGPFQPHILADLAVRFVARAPTPEGDEASERFV